MDSQSTDSLLGSQDEDYSSTTDAISTEETTASTIYGRCVHPHSIPNSDMFCSVSNPQNSGIAPCLSQGKKYHVFFSYESSERDWVEDVARRLETPERGFRCSIHERDFHGGKRIIENITEHIRISEKTVLVLSPDFIQSHWCMFEIELGMVLSMEERQLLVVPVMVRQCDVPDSIKTLTYIDATPGNDWWQRFMVAITTQDELLSTFSGTKDLTVHPRYENMDFLTKLSSKYKCSSGSELRTPYVPEALMRSGAQVSIDDFDSAMDIIRSSSDCCCRCLCDGVGVCTASFVILILLCLVATPLLTVYFFPYHFLDTTRDEYTTAIITPLSIIPLIVVAFVFFVQRSVRKSKVEISVKETNEVFLKSNVIAGVTVDRSFSMLFKINVKFWFYNISECGKHLTFYLQQKLEDNDPLRQDILQARATRLIYHHSGEYTSAYIHGQLRPKHGTRHVRNASCLCQFIEEKYADENDIPDV